MAFGYFKDLTRRAASDKILHDKVFIIAKKWNMIDISVDLFECFINFLIKKLQVEPLHLHGNKSAIKNENNSNKELAEELHKPIIIKLNKRQAQSPFLDNILGDNPADMSLISKFNKKIRDL